MTHRDNEEKMSEKQITEEVFLDGHTNIWVYCDAKTNKPIKSLTQGKVMLMTRKPSIAQLRSAAFQHRKPIIARQGFIILLRPTEEHP